VDIAPSRKSFARKYIFLIYSTAPQRGLGLVRRPIHILGQPLTLPEGEKVDFRFSETDDSDESRNDGHVFGVQRSGGGGELAL
jgi:hypothetical protein